jgi:uncharacterized membrane protein YheB (UPF0754 family)
MDIWWLICLPLIGALIGWLTNRVAIQMLFRPRQPVRIFSWRWQGLIPRRQKDLAAKVAEIIEQEILQQHVLRAELHKLPIHQWLDDFAQKIIHLRVAPKLKKLPIFGHFIGESIIEKLEVIAKEALAEEAPPLMEQMVSELEKNLSVRDLVRQRVEDFDMDTLERVIRDLAHKEFSRIEWLGGILGFFIGTIQALIGWLVMGGAA